MQQETSFHGGPDHRGAGAADRDDRPSETLAAVNERLTRDLHIAQAHERTLMFELADSARDLHEKDFLLREAEHRLKNTLHLACGLLQSQADSVREQSARRELESASERLRAIAEVQVALHEVGDHVDLHQWLPRLCRAMALKPGLQLDAWAPAITVAGSVASPIGLFVWEAVCNVIKHAFPDDETGRVQVRLAREQDDWRLSVSDDGRGSPERIAPGFGLRLLGLLARQLRGRLDIGRGLDGRGLSVSAVFPLAEPARPGMDHA
jgi:two-component sensor histidine kinase